ncbi:MAG TPA: aldo/keto reductase [Bryobacteraceae bacterium]|nr:aldo/keto reductase [Bryobacteraceae bacterium]
MERRDFLKSAALSGVVASAAQRGIPRRKYKGNIELSVIGFGGIVVCGMEQKDADRTVAASFDRGINYYDVAPSYFDGEAETKLGIALAPYRKNAFLACKTTERDAKGAQKELEQSLQRLKTDHFDLYQFHAVTKMDEVERIFGPGGAAETFVKAKKDGKVRHLGCSAHSEEAAIAMMDRIQLDSILFPINFVLYAHGFGPKVVEHAKSKGVARLALKALAHKPWEKSADRKAHPKTWYEPIANRDLAAKALRFTLSEDVTAAIPPGDEKIYHLALDLAQEYQPLASAERTELLAQARSIAPLFPAHG